MNQDDTTKDKIVHLCAFTTRKCVNGFAIIKNGKFKVALRASLQSHTRGNLILNGKDLPIVSSSRNSILTPMEIDKNTCIVLFEANSAYKFAVLVNDITEITTVTQDLI